jgi:hypothetical protein
MNNPVRLDDKSDYYGRVTFLLPSEVSERRIRARRLTFNLHTLIRQNKGDDDEADAIREAMMDLWTELSPMDRRRMNDFSGNLYNLSDSEFHKSRCFDVMDSRLIRIYWRFQYIRSDRRDTVQDSIGPNYLLWTVEDKCLSFELSESNVVCMNGYDSNPAYNPSFDETLEAMNWLLDNIQVHISYPP